MDTLIRVVQLLLSLSILVLLHEWGHYITARMFKTRVEKFYLFFDFLFPFPHIFNFAIFKKKIGETEYGLGWFPLGGYVKIAGMIDESMDEEAMKLPPKPDEFRSKPAWQRLIIMLGGIIVNLILAFFIYSMILLATGSDKISVADAKYGFAMDSLAQSIGLQNGDKIVGYDHKHVFETADATVFTDLLLNDAKVLQVERGGKTLDVNVPEGVYPAIVQAKGGIEFIRLAFPAEVDSATSDGVVFDKLKHNDRVISVAGYPVTYFAEISFALKGKKGMPVIVQALRGADTVAFTVTVPENEKLGIAPKDAENYFKVEHTDYNLLTCFPAGFKHCGEVLSGYAKQFRIIFSPRFKGWKQIGGFGTIAKLYPTKWDWLAFWSGTAFLSLVLAFMNVLPIPALDGGHALFTIYEIVFRRKPSDKFLEYAQMVGMVLVLGLVIFANGNDLVRLISGWFK